MVCPKCSKEVREGSLRCDICGYEIEEKKEQIINTGIVNNENIAITKSEDKSNNTVNCLLENKNKAAYNAELKRKLLKQIEESNTDKEIFGNFITKQKKQTKKKFLLTTLLCLLLLGGSGFIIYKEFFCYDDIMRNVAIGMTYNNVLYAEEQMRDSSKPEEYGNGLLVYEGIKFKSLKGEAFYYFNQDNKQLSYVSFKFDYTDEGYDLLLDSLVDEYGDYAKDNADTDDTVYTWTNDDGHLVRIIASANHKVIEVDVVKGEKSA